MRHTPRKTQDWKIGLLFIGALFGAFPVYSENAAPEKTVPFDAHIKKLEALHQRAEEYILMNDFHRAIHLYLDLILEEPDDETAYTGLAQCYMVLGQYGKAKEAYYNALDINPDNETAVAGLKKIEDPDSMDFSLEEKVNDAETSAADTQAPKEIIAESAITPKPLAAEETNLILGAKNTMTPYCTTTPPLLQGKSRIEQIQIALTQAGVYHGKWSGVMDGPTKMAVKKFQSMYDLEVDGLVGSKTWALLQPFLDRHSFSSEKKNSA